MNAFPFNTVAGCFAFLLFHGYAKITHDHAVNPAYRPSSENATEFVEDLQNTTIAVYPSIIRTLEGTMYSENSQQQVATAVPEISKIHRPALKGESR